MEAKDVDGDEIAELKRLIVRQQELVAECERSGQKQQARRARDSLYEMLHRLDLVQETS